jgi:RND family efflux transporter MFP subunit
LAIQQQYLSDTEIRAPFAGVVIAKAAQPGEMISPVSAGGGFTRTGICTIVDMASLEIEVDVNESYINRVTSGQPVTAVLDSYEDWQIPAKVITIIPTADRNKATVRVRIAFLESDTRILPDMGVKVSFLDDSPKQASTKQLVGVLVPGNAVTSLNNESVVFVVDGDIVERRVVRVGGRQGSARNITAGLAVGEKVITDLSEALIASLDNDQRVITN